MIKMLEIKTGSAFWEIDGVILRFQRKKSIGDERTGQLITEYREFLLNENYRSNPTKLCELTDILGDVILLRIGSEAYFDAFIKMYSFYAELYVAACCNAGKRFVSNKTSFFPVFSYMFKNELVDTKESHFAILKYASCENKIFSDIYDEKLTAFWAGQIKNKVESQEPLHVVKEQIGALQATKSLIQIETPVLRTYLKAIAEAFTKERKIITVQSFYRSLFGDKIGVSRGRFCPEFVRMTDEIVHHEYAIQCKKLMAENHLQLNMNKDKWLICYKHGPSLYSNTIDFTPIQSPSLRLEIKYFMRYRYYHISAKKDAIIYSLADAVNLLADRNPSIHFMADIDDVDVRMLYMAMERRYGQDSGKSVSNIMRVFSSLSVLIDYLMSDRRDIAMCSPRPHDNPFKRYKFNNCNDYKVRTTIIPEAVAEGIDAHIHELDDTQALLYRIFSNTGMRMKEVLFLEADCLEASPYEGLVQLKYKPYKTLKARRKQGTPDYHRVLIFRALADEIAAEIQKRSKLREKLAIPYIFVNKRPNFRAGMLNMGNYVLIINKLIQKHNLCDESGAVWQFTSKQQRKTLAVTLIENGASVEELAYWLGHLGRNTAAAYYAEVRKAKLATLNTDFYRKKFNLLLSEEQLTEYSEEERRLLYMDFRLEQRRVELAYCLKKLADGGCTNRNSLFNCVNCRNLCTGVTYLPHWKALLLSQTEVIEGLLLSYQKANIMNYEEFREYKQALFFKHYYENVITAIEGGGADGISPV